MDALWSLLRRRVLFFVSTVLLIVVILSVNELCRQPMLWQTQPVTRTQVALPPRTDVPEPRVLPAARQILTYGRRSELSVQAHSSESSITVSLSSPTALTRSELDNVTERVSSLSSPRSRPSRHGYLLVLKSIGGAQQAAGLRSFLPAQCWLGSFGLPMKLVQPFIDNSVVHTRPPSRKHKPLTMADFFDIDHFNNASRRLGWAGVVTWQEFIAKAPRKAIYIVPLHLSRCQCLLSREHAIQKPMKVLWNQSDGERRCYNNNAGELYRLTSQHNFCIVRAVEAHPTPRLCEANEVDKVIFGDWIPSDVTLIVQQWCPGMYVPNPALPNPNICKNACAELSDIFRPSQQLLSRVEAYERKNSLDKEHFKTAVMLRSEHVLTEARGLTQKFTVIDTCLSRTAQIVHHVQAKSMNETLFLTADIGQYGSSQQSWSNTLGRSNSKNVILAMVKDTAMELLNTSLTFKEWEDTFVDAAGTSDRGYIAALQRNVASRAKCLIILGGGNFARLTLVQYLNEHPDPSSWCLHFVCLKDRYSREYSNEVESQSQHTVGTKWTPVSSDISWLYVVSLSRSSV